ncbi:hypothetical protein FOIG_06540 [Fusarium odoratissimum NRRL 54006]|uniref:Uncharacterized protein n=2 Tax=Fusarium oxysporum species complex TaxID=171631 RepID=X0KZX4_FUSO5|nr:uncharacterized protein FOIG_06540 [Fusarium odoratissimum NRRL 54006]EXM02270.1 hypothetical protein FOIG_06540 [Fusarium odoratissimum NRRL 54006]TXC07075.1 hypothetical protein FocTR4_00003941 [Fusarium oxysporum f. sp. cubense]
MLFRPTVLVQHRYIGLTRTAPLLTTALVPRSEIHQTPRTRVCFELQAGKNNTDFYVLRVVPNFRGAQSKSAQRTRNLRYRLLKVVAFIGDSSALTPAKSRSRVISSGHALALYKAAIHKLSTACTKDLCSASVFSTSSVDHAPDDIPLLPQVTHKVQGGSWKYAVIRLCALYEYRDSVPS